MHRSIIAGTFLFFLLSGCASTPSGNAEDAELFTNRGCAYLLTMNYKEALKDFNHAIRLNPDYQPAYKYRGITYIMLRRDLKASFDFLTATSKKKDDPEACYLYGTWLLAFGDLQRALEYYNKFQLYGENFIKPGFYEARGQIHLALEKYKEALDDFEKFSWLDTTDKSADFYIDRSKAYSGMEAYTEALADIDTAIGLSPHNGDGYYYRSNVYEQTGRYQEALEDINTALRLKPERARLYRRIIRRIEKSIQKGKQDF
jgi:tetratricopeptide (TPR) repeat protein